MNLNERGAVFPHRLPEFARSMPEGRQQHLVRWFWGASWSLPDDASSKQAVVPFSTCNLVVEAGRAIVTAPVIGASSKVLRGSGWAVAAMLQPAATHALVGSPSALEHGFVAVQATDLVDDLTTAMDAPGPFAERIGEAHARLGSWIEQQVPAINTSGLRANHLVEIVDAAEGSAAVRDVAEAANLSLRTAQRVASEYVGVSLGGMMRQRRIQVALQDMRRLPATPLAHIAAADGYADQSHLAAEIRRVLGSTAGAYRDAASSGHQPAGGDGPAPDPSRLASTSL